MAVSPPVRAEARALVHIATPVVIAEIGWMSMGLVDTVMVGPLGPEAIAATGLGTGVFTTIAIFGMGLLLGLDTLVSQAFGAGKTDECRRLLGQGLWLAAMLTPLVLACAAAAYLSLDWWSLNPAIEALTRPYLAVVSLSAAPLLVYAAFRRYLQGVHVVAPIMVALLSANAVNVVANYVLIYGALGIPAFGVAGSAAATTLARIYMAVFLWLAARRVIPRHTGRDAVVQRMPLDVDRLRRLIVLGFPAAAQVTLEVGAFTFATALAARLDAAASAAHQIALNLSGLAYMIPLGLCSATAVRVGHAIGARDRQRAIDAGWLAVGMAALLALVTASIMLVLPGPLVGLFTREPSVLMMGTSLLAIAAAFQLFDGVQTVAIGALRGLGDTFVPMITNLVVHWLLGLPLGYILCFHVGMGVSGIWLGFSAGLVVASIVLLGTWLYRTRTLELTPLPRPFLQQP